MARCNGCGGIIGLDCFNPVECVDIGNRIQYTNFENLRENNAKQSYDDAVLTIASMQTQINELTEQIADKEKEVEKHKNSAQELYRALDLMQQVYWPMQGQQELTYAQEQAQEFGFKALVANDAYKTNGGLPRREITKRIKSKSETESEGKDLLLKEAKFMLSEALKYVSYNKEVRLPFEEFLTKLNTKDI